MKEGKMLNNGEAKIDGVCKGRKERIWNDNAMDDGTRNGAGRWERRRAGRSDTQEPEGEAQLCTRHESWEQPSEAVDRAGLGSRDPGAQGRASCHLAELQDQQNAKEMLAAKQLAEKNQKDEEAFLAVNKAKEGVVTLASGLQYKILKAGDGKKPTVDDTVVCYYWGTLIDGTEFDSSYSRSQPATFAVNRVIKGWTEALQLMPVGSKWQLFIPPNLAYGATGSGRVNTG